MPRDIIGKIKIKHNIFFYISPIFVQTSVAIQQILVVHEYFHALFAFGIELVRK